MKKKFNFSINKTALNDYTNEMSQELITKAVIGAETLNHISVMTGVKYKENMKYMTTDAVFQAGGCGFSANGTTTLADKDMQVLTLKVNEALCPEDLNTTGLQLSMTPGYNEELPFEQQYAEYKAAKISEAIENMIWGTSSGTTTAFQGFRYKLDNDSDVVDVSFNPVATGLTSAQFIDGLFSMVNAVPAAIKNKGLKMFVGSDILQLATQHYIKSGYATIGDVSGNDGVQSLRIIGTNVDMVVAPGLNGTNRIVIAEPSNLVFGTDLENEQDDMKIFWDESNQEVRVVANFKGGVQYHFGDQIVINQL